MTENFVINNKNAFFNELEIVDCEIEQRDLTYITIRLVLFEYQSTVLESSDPDSMMRRHSGMISVVRRKLMTSCSSVLTSAPITPRLVSRRYSNGRVLLTVCRNGYRNRGMRAEDRKH